MLEETDENSKHLAKEIAQDLNVDVIIITIKELFEKFVSLSIFITLLYYFIE